MIAYDLQCSGGHRFEGWFEDSNAFEQQCRQGLVTCPVCNSTEVARIPSTFAIKGIKNPLPANPQQRSTSEKEIMARAVMHFVENNFDNVGADFATEALKIHYGVSEPRNIRGVSTEKEEQTLRQEGVEFFKFPLPDSSETNSSSSDS